MILLPKRVLDVLGAKQLAKQEQITSLFAHQCQQMQQIIARQKSMTGKDPLLPEGSPDRSFTAVDDALKILHPENATAAVGKA